MKLPDKGLIAAIAAVAIFGAIIGWRVISSGEGQPAETEQAGISTPISIEQLAAEAEENPEDSQGWQRLGLALFQANRFVESVTAYEKAAAADAESAVLWSSLGEARVMASQDDPLPAAAIEAFETALKLDPTDPRARYFMAVRRDLSGDHEGAITAWLALLADSPPGAPWETDLVRTIQQVAAINDIDVTGRIEEAAGTRDILPSDALAANAAMGRGPTAEQMATAAALPAAEQQNMAEGMVSRLAARLEAEPGDVDGWIMLMRSYRQLGRNSDAQSARDRAMAANPGAREQIETAAQTLGVQ